MKCRATVTFEFHDGRRPAQEHRIAVLEAYGPQTHARMAITEARTQLKPINWSSIVLLLERLDENAGTPPEAVETGWGACKAARGLV